MNTDNNNDPGYDELSDYESNPQDMDMIAWAVYIGMLIVCALVIAAIYLIKKNHLKL